MTMMYFAADGSYGDAEGLVVVDTADWSDDEFDAVVGCADSERRDLARELKSNGGSRDL